MSNKLVCPTCNNTHEVKEYICATDAQMAFNIALTIPPEISTLVLKYVQLFAPAKSALTLERQAKIIESMHLEGCDVERVAYGIRAVLDNHANGKITSPLNTKHGYLKGCMNGYTPPNVEEQQKYTLTDKQIKFFGYRLCQNSNFAMKYSNTGETDGEFMVRVEHSLRDPKNVKKWYGYIEVIKQQANQNH